MCFYLIVGTKLKKNKKNKKEEEEGEEILFKNHVFLTCQFYRPI